MEDRRLGGGGDLAEMSDFQCDRQSNEMVETKARRNGGVGCMRRRCAAMARRIALWNSAAIGALDFGWGGDGAVCGGGGWGVCFGVRQGDSTGINNMGCGGTIRSMRCLHDFTFYLPRISAARRHVGLVRFSVLGSVLAKRFRLGSDVDVMVETDPLDPPGPLALGGLQMVLSDILGRNIHMISIGGVPARERPGVAARAKNQFADQIII